MARRDRQRPPINHGARVVTTLCLQSLGATAHLRTSVLVLPLLYRCSGGSDLFAVSFRGSDKALTTLVYVSENLPESCYRED